MDMNEDQKHAYETIISGQNLLLTSNAGTGKTFIIKSEIKYLREKGKCVDLTCSTGLATTLHKWDGQYSNGELLHLISNDERYEKVKKSIKECEFLFIDEISMISTKILGQVEFLCKSLKIQNCFFGGITVVLSGDIFQLPPVENKLYGDFGHHCFLLPWFKEAFRHHINLNPCLLML